MRRETTIILITVLALVTIGVLTISSVSAVKGAALLRHELIYVALGLACMFFFAHFDYHRFADPPIYRSLLLAALLLLVLVLVPGIGAVRGGAQRWIDLKFTRFQPSEAAKFALIVMLAIKLTANQEQVRDFFKGFVPPMLIAGFFAGLVLLERDLGVPVVLMAVAFIMVLVAGARLSFVIASCVPVAAGVALLIWTNPYRVERVLAFMDPWSDKSDSGFHLIQSLAGFARGSLWGLGAGASEQKLFYLPAAHTDFIFAVWAEEMGLLGTLTVVALFAVFVVAGFRVALWARDLFGGLLATGIVSLIALQASFNMAVTVGLLPTKGLPLPFISYGGTSLIVLLALAGVLLNVGLQANDQPIQRNVSAPDKRGHAFGV